MAVEFQFYMSNESATRSGLLSDITHHLGEIIRYTLPGVLVIGGARLAYPEAFCAVDVQSSQHLIILAVVTVTVGNALVALNRYGVHQVVDWVCYLLKIEGPIPKAGRAHYHNGLGHHVLDSFLPAAQLDPAQRYVSFRASTAFLLLTLGEILLTFSCHHSKYSVLNAHVKALKIIGFAALAAYLWQSIIARKIDYLIVSKKAMAESNKEQRSG